MFHLELNRYSESGQTKTANIKYLLFDVEGVIIDSVGAQIESFCKALNELGQKHLSDEAYHKLISGRSRDGGFRNFLGIPRKEEASAEQNLLVDKLCKKKDEIFQNMLMTGGVKAFPAVVDMIKQLRAKGIKMSFASGSSNAAMMLYKAGILQEFEVGVLKGRDGTALAGKYVTMPDTKITLDPHETEIPEKYFKKCDVEFHGKPQPWIFYKAAHKMGANPFKCAVIEDSPQIIEENFEAGFGSTIGVDTGNAFKAGLVRAGTVFYCEKGETAQNVAEKFRNHMLSRLTETLSKSPETSPENDVYKSLHQHKDHHPGFFAPSSSASSSATEANGVSHIPTSPTQH